MNLKFLEEFEQLCLKYDVMLVSEDPYCSLEIESLQRLTLIGQIKHLKNRIIEWHATVGE